MNLKNEFEWMNSDFDLCPGWGVDLFARVISCAVMELVTCVYCWLLFCLSFFFTSAVFFKYQRWKGAWFFEVLLFSKNSR